MSRWKKWTLPVIGAGLALLSLWGWWGMGTASQLFPEKHEPPRAAARKTTVKQDAEADDEMPGKAIRRYDASTHRRSYPLKDPFHADAAGQAEEQRKEEAVSVSLPKAAPSPPATSRQERAAPALPVLKGVMAFGEKRRALLDIGGTSYTASVGEQAGTWTVQHIGEKSVDLANGPNSLHLSL